jgi:RNA polymerase sigma factor (sigma-70 family)
MEELSPSRGKKQLTREEFDLLLSKLHPDRERAGEEYLFLWEKLRFFFQTRKCTYAEELADETLYRAAGKIRQGVEVLNLPAYCYGIARHVWQEALNKSETGIPTLEEDAPGGAHRLPHQIDEIENKEQRDCLEKCLRELPPDEAELFIAYFIHDDISNAEARREIAERLDITPTALRLRIMRIREKLLECVRKCSGEKPKK